MLLPVGQSYLLNDVIAQDACMCAVEPSDQCFQPLVTPPVILLMAQQLSRLADQHRCKHIETLLSVAVVH